MKISLVFLLDNYRVEIIAVDQHAANQLTAMKSSIQSLSNPREILSLIESVVGVESTTIKDINTNDMIISSGLLHPEEN